MAFQRLGLDYSIAGSIGIDSITSISTGAFELHVL